MDETHYLLPGRTATPNLNIAVIFITDDMPFYSQPVPLEVRDGRRRNSLAAIAIKRFARISKVVA